MAESSRQNSRVPMPSNAWSFPQFPRSPHNIASSATQRIQDLQYYVVQGLSPLINSSTHRLPSHPWSHERLEGEQNIPAPRRLSADNSSHDFVIDVDSADSDLTPEPEAFNNGQHVPPTSRNRSSDTSPELENLRNVPEFQIVMGFAEKYVPFLSILIMKLVFDHKLGILSIAGLFCTFCYANSVVKREVAKQSKRRLLSLIWVFCNLVMCIIIIYSVLADEGAAFALIFITPYSAPITIWDVLWIVCITDFVIRILAVLVKVVILAIPARIVAFHKKGNHYLFVESTSQLYRTIAPMQHWLYFFSESYTGPSKVFGVILSAAYLIFKCKNILHKGKTWKRTFFKILQSKTYGITPNGNQIKEAGQLCPICQDDYKSPAMLPCKHIFCEDCVALWFDRERTCPLCRAQIADDPRWRDGSTSLALQIF